MARSSLEKSYETCPIESNAHIRISLSEVYKKIGLQDKAIEVLSNASPPIAANVIKLPNKRKRYFY
jgi:hypothetical protein